LHQPDAHAGKAQALLLGSKAICFGAFQHCLNRDCGCRRRQARIAALNGCGANDLLVLSGCGAMFGLVRISALIGEIASRNRGSSHAILGRLRDTGGF
jgi:hypothetical protein